MSDVPHDQISFAEASDPNTPLNKAYPVKPQPGWTFKVHDHGFVRYIDHMGTDQRITEAARVSYGATNKTAEDDRKLLRRLFKDKHTSPFEMCKVTFNIRMPIFVMRQYVRHRMQNLNEFSMRYKEAPDVFFVPEKWRAQDTKNKQSSVAANLELKCDAECRDMDGSKYYTRDISAYVTNFYERAYHVYKMLLEAGVAREQARIVLPVGIYTEIYCCWDLHNLIHYFYLRDDPHAQGEHQDYAKAMKQIVAALFPWTMEVYEESLAEKNARKLEDEKKHANKGS